jgi:hypothetical protein
MTRREVQGTGVDEGKGVREGARVAVEVGVGIGVGVRACVDVGTKGVEEGDGSGEGEGRAVVGTGEGLVGVGSFVRHPTNAKISTIKTTCAACLRRVLTIPPSDYLL